MKPVPLQAGSASAGTDTAGAASRKAARRLLPFLMLCYFCAYLDRVNVSFAALTMNRDLGLSASAYGFGAGLFFLGYVAFEIPSNLILERVGARLWIARIMVTWSLISGATAFVTGETTFSLARLALGLAEAGFFPGIILYLTLWFPAEQRGRIIGTFMVAVPLSAAVGGPVSGLILTATDGALGLAGWQWLYLIEAAPSLVLGVLTLTVLTDRPADAAWLTPAERTALAARLAADARPDAAEHPGHRDCQRCGSRACWAWRWSISGSAPGSTPSASGSRRSWQDSASPPSPPASSARCPIAPPPP